MDADKCELILKDEVYRIVGAAMEVSNELGNGFLEAVYQEALGMELGRRQIPHTQQQRITISYKNTTLDKKYIADYVCFEQVIVEIKALRSITGIEESQLLNYLKATGFPVGLIINFGTPKLQWKRYANTRNISDHSRPFAVNSKGNE